MKQKQAISIEFTRDSNRENDIMKQWKHFSIGFIRFDSAQVKRDLISSIINYVHKLPHESPTDISFRKISELVGSRV